jgi:nodulation protein A
LHWEADLSRADHDALGALLAKVYPAHEATFRERSFAYARPEGRIVGYDGELPVAHLGFLRRMLRVDTGAQLVGDVGLVGVHPDLRGTGLGKRLLVETAAELDRLALPFGFLTCRPAIVPFYESGGWVRISGQITRMVNEHGEQETYSGPALVLPIRAAIAEWPRSTVIRDGLEV